MLDSLFLYGGLQGPEKGLAVVDGSSLRALRRSLNLKLQHVAEGVGRSPSFISNLERGLASGSPEEFARIEAFLSGQTQVEIPSTAPRRRRPSRCID